MDIYSLTKKQRPTHLTRGELDKTNTQSAMAPVEQHSQLPPECKQQQRQQQQAAVDAPPTLQDIENKHSQLPPQYRQAVLEQQQREHQQRLLQQQQGSPTVDSQRPLQSASVTSSPNGNGTANGAGNVARRGSFNSTHQRVVSAPLVNSYRSDHNSSYTTNVSPGPSRAHWKPDNSTQVCTWPGCLREFGFFDRRHHCRKCGDIFCSAHCSKAIPLDQALDFNPAMGIMSRACTGCFEAFEQWQGFAPTTPFASQNNTRNPFGSVSDSQITGEYASPTKNGGSLSPSNARKTEGLLGQADSTVSGEAMGRDDIVRLPKSASDNIAIKARPVQDTAAMPMPSVPHDWSWSTF
ncbi:hypothetical protein EDD21DRAFT_386143 [Dissophora ornata]|nr:hypothetical protein EDD21DRAFT_386143 [Dissophora ornata]